jgi:hypothetical protein
VKSNSFALSHRGAGNKPPSRLDFRAFSRKTA